MKNVELGRCRGLGIRVVSWALVSCAVLLGAGGCEPVAQAPTLEAREQGIESDNRLSVNGLSFNGLSFNGLSFNGLSFNGLSAQSFESWFQSNPGLADEVMRYVVRCAVPAGQTRTFTNTATGVTHTWAGVLGLAPGWAGGAAATTAEQQVVSACLAAHVNPYGTSVPISVLGRDGQGQVLPYTAEELNTFPKHESCFFGNLFTGQGLFAGSEGTLLTQAQSTSRACAVVDSSGKQRASCSPLVFVGDCSLRCTQEASGLSFASCDHDGVRYLPLTTRVRDQDIFWCGDGTCQATESCGSSTTYDSCQPDCGPCR